MDSKVPNKRDVFHQWGWGWKTLLRVCGECGWDAETSGWGMVWERGDWSVGERTDWWCLCGLCLLLSFVVPLGALLHSIYMKLTWRRVAFILNCEWSWEATTTTTTTKKVHTYSNILNKASKFYMAVFKIGTVQGFVWFRLAWPRSHCWSVWRETPWQDSLFPDWLFCPPFAWREEESEQTAPFSLLVNRWASTLRSSEVFRVSGHSHQSRVARPSQMTPGTHFPPWSYMHALHQKFAATPPRGSRVLQLCVCLLLTLP